MGEKISLTELFKRRSAENKAAFEAQQAWEATPEGAAWRAEQDAHHKRMADADERYAVEHPEPEEDDEGEGSDDE